MTPTIGQHTLDVSDRMSEKLGFFKVMWCDHDGNEICGTAACIEPPHVIDNIVAEYDMHFSGTSDERENLQRRLSSQVWAKKNANAFKSTFEHVGEFILMETSIKAVDKNGKSS